MYFEGYHAVVCSDLSLAEQYSTACIFHGLHVHLPVSGHLDWLYSFGCYGYTTVNIHMDVGFYFSWIISLGSYGKFMCNFSSSSQIVLQSGSTVLHPTAMWEGSSISTFSSSILVIPFLWIAILAGVKWYFIVVVICFSLMNKMLSLFSMYNFIGKIYIKLLPVIFLFFHKR